MASLSWNWLFNVPGFTPDFPQILPAAVAATLALTLIICLVRPLVMQSKGSKTSQRHLQLPKAIQRSPKWIQNFGQVSPVPSEKEMGILIQGFGASGKATILQKFKAYAPGIDFNVETIKSLKEKMAHDSMEMYEEMLRSSGRCPLRPLERQKYLSTKVFIFVIDSTDHVRIAQVREELWKLLDTLHVHMVRDAVLLVLANKQDLPDAMSVADVTDKLDLNRIKDRKWSIQPCSATTGMGLFEALHWAMNMLSGKGKVHSSSDFQAHADEAYLLRKQVGFNRFFQPAFWMKHGLSLL